MKSDANTPREYIDRLPVERKSVVEQLRRVIVENLPGGFMETMSYGMIGYVIPHDVYPPGYHCDASLPLPFINIASQKNHIALYHSGVYAKPELRDWFVREYEAQCHKKPDMGKSCIRFKASDDIPWALIGALASKMTPKEWIVAYESAIKGRGKKP